MQQPTKPYKPSLPKLPSETIEVTNNSYRQIIRDGDSLETIFKNVLGQDEGIKIEDIIRNAHFDFTYYADGIDNVDFVICENKLEKNPNYEKELKKYEKDLKKYKGKLEVYKEKMKQYNLDVTAYKEYIETGKKLEKQKKIQEAQELLKKEGLL